MLLVYNVHTHVRIQYLVDKLNLIAKYSQRVLHILVGKLAFKLLLRTLVTHLYMVSAILPEDASLQGIWTI